MTLPSCLLLMVLTTLTVPKMVFSTGDVGEYYKVHPNMFMVVSSDAIITKLQTETELACVSECRFHCRCEAINVFQTNATALFECTLLNITTLDEGAVIQEQHGARYIEFNQEKQMDEDCDTWMKKGCMSSRVYSLARKNGENITTFCDMQTGNGGWTVVQRRLNSSVDFYRGWQQYKRGFGNALGEFWLGLDNLHSLTSSGGYTLRFDLWDDAEHRFAEYNNVAIANEADNYRLNYDSYNGYAGDSMEVSNGQAFSTKDKDNDLFSRHCASEFRGAWWYKACHRVNLNGLYLNGSNNWRAAGIVWNGFRGLSYSLLKTEMKVKRTFN